MKRKMINLLMILSAVSLNSFSVSAQDEVNAIRTLMNEMKSDLGGVVITSQTDMSIQGMEMIAEAKTYKSGQKTRNESTISGIPGMPGPMTMITLFDGADFWMISAQTGKQKADKNNPMAKMSKSAFDSELPENAKFVKAEKVGDRDCYVFESSIQNPQMGTITSQVWLDKKNGVFVKSETTTMQGNVSMKADSFKKLKGKWELPDKISGTMGGSPFMNAVLSSVLIDQKLEDDLFNAEKTQIP